MEPRRSHVSHGDGAGDNAGDVIIWEEELHEARRTF